MGIRLGFYLLYYALNAVIFHDAMMIALTLPILAMILYDVSTIRTKFISVQEVFAFCFYLFFVIAPLQTVSGLGNAVIGNGEVFFGRRILLIAMFGVQLSYLFYILTRRMLAAKPVQFDVIHLPVSFSAVITGATVACALAYIIFSGGLSVVSAGRYEQKEADVSPLVSVFLAATVILAMLQTTIGVRSRHPAALALMVVCLMAVFVLLNPFNTSRFRLIGTYLPLALIFIRGQLKSAFFYAGSLFAIIVIMPILSMTSRFGSLEAAAVFSQRDEAAGSGLFSLPYIDVFPMWMACVKYTYAHGITYGAKLIGTIFFIVPRSIWTNKPTLNGLDVGEEIFQLGGAGTSNLSMNLGADIYRDFGLIGTALAGILIGLCIVRLFEKRVLLVNNEPIVQYLSLATIPILMRGPLQAVVGTFFMEYVLLMIFAFLCRRAGLSRPVTRAVDPPRRLVRTGRGGGTPRFPQPGALGR